MPGSATDFKEELRALLHKYNVDGRTQIPDLVLADYLIGQIQNVSAMIYAREKYGYAP